MAILTGIDPGAYAIKIVQGQMKGPIFQVLRAVEIPIEPSEDRETAILAALATEVGALKLKPGVIRMGITGRDLMIRYTTVPPVPLWRLRMLMDFEVQDMAQSSGDPLTADYNLLTQAEGASDETVLVALVKQHFLDARLQAATQGAGLKVHATTPNCIAVFDSFLAFGDIEENEYTLLVDIGDRNLEMAVQRDGELIFARHLSAGGHAFTEAIAETWGVGVEKARELKHEYGNVTPRGKAQYGSSAEEKVANALLGVAGQLAGMLQSTIAFSRSQTGHRDLEIGRVVLSGGGSRLVGLDAYLEQNLRIPVQRFAPENGLDASGLAPEEAETFASCGGDFAVALGLARMSEDPDAFVIDLVPEATKKKRRFLQRTAWMIAAAVVLVAYLGWLWVDLQGQSDAAKAARAAARRKERQALNVQRRYDETIQAAALVKAKIDLLAWETRPGAYLELGQRVVQECAPRAVWIKSLEVAARDLAPPSDEEADKKSRVSKVVVIVKGRVWNLDAQVRQAYSRFVTDLRAVSKRLVDEARARAETGDVASGPPVVVSTDDPDRDGDEFELMIDFAGWPIGEATSEEEGS